jgi:hypothetical protein
MTWSRSRPARLSSPVAGERASEGRAAFGVRIGAPGVEAPADYLQLF